jgi:hypothetical protein
LLTTFTEKVRAAAKREPIAFSLLAFLLLTGATGAGMTARHILTAAPASGAVNLAVATGVEGTSTALMRADAQLGVTGILPAANGGTGATSGAVLLQSSTPGSAQTGNANITGTMNAGLFKAANTSGVLTSLEDINNSQWSFSVTGNKATPAYRWTITSTNGAPTNLYTFGSNFSGTPIDIFTLSPKGRARVAPKNYSGTANSGGIATLAEDQTVYIGSNRGADAGPIVTLDTLGTTAVAGLLFDIQNNTTSKFSVDFAGVVTVPTGTMPVTIGKGSQALTLLSIPASGCSYHGTNTTVSGAAIATDVCLANYPSGFGMEYYCEVTAANTISWKFCNPTGLAYNTPTANSFTYKVIR